MALPDFPNNPTLNEQFTVGTNIYQWDGEKWKALSNADNSLRSQLADVDSTVLVGGVEAGDIVDRIANVKDFGAVGDGVADDTTAVQSALSDAGSDFKTVRFPKGTYLITSTLNVPSNVKIEAEIGGEVVIDDAVAAQGFLVQSQSNVVVKNLKVAASGNAFTSGTQRLFQVNASSRISFVDCFFTKARNEAVVVDSSSKVSIRNCNFENNYTSAVVFRNGSSECVTSDCLFLGNGDTGVASSTGGRGLLTWESENITVTNCVFKENNEYGLRLFSQGSDTLPSKNISISNCTFDNNGTVSSGKIDLYMFNESGLISNVTVSGCTFKVRQLNVGLAIQGQNIAVSGCSFTSITAGSSTAISFFKCEGVQVTGCTIENFGSVASYSGSVGSESDRVSLSSCVFKDCAKITSNLNGSNNTVSNCTFSYGNGTNTENAISCTATTASNTRIINNNFVNCYRVAELNITNCDVDFSGNRCSGTTNRTLTVVGTDLSNLIIHDNVLDVAASPTEVGRFERGGHSLARVEGHTSTIPTAAGFVLSYSQGDKFYNLNLAAGGTVGWVCTTAGTPGTWKAFGTIEA